MSISKQSRSRPLAIDAGLHDRGDVLLHHQRAGDKGGDLLLLLHLPADIGLDIRVIDVDHHHLGGAPGGAAGFDRAGGAVADLEEAHQARRLAAARQRLVLAAQLREVRAGARAVFEQPRLAHPQIHDAVVVDEIVLDRLDEAGMRLGMLIGGARLDELAGLVVDIEMALARPVYAIGPVEAGVEPLRRVGRAFLARQHEAMLVIEGARILLAVEIAALPAPIGPGAGEPVEDLLGGALRAGALAVGKLGEGRIVRHRAPQPGRHAVFLDPLDSPRHPGLAEIFLSENVRGNLAPAGGNLDRLLAEHHRAVRIPDLTGHVAEREPLIGRLAVCREPALNTHCLPRSCWLSFAQPFPFGPNGPAPKIPISRSCPARFATSARAYNSLLFFSQPLHI